MRENILFHTHLSRTRSICIRRGAFHTPQKRRGFHRAGADASANSAMGRAFWRIRLAPTTLETTRRRPFFQVFRKGRLPALASPLETP